VNNRPMYWRSVCGLVLAGFLAFLFQNSALAIPPPSSNAASRVANPPWVDTETTPNGEPRTAVRILPEGGVAAVAVGGDDCHTATVTSILAGPPGTPTTVTINGDSTGVTSPECDPSLGSPIWWEAFEIDKCANVVIDFCGNSPRLSPSFVILATQCAGDGSSCGGYVSQNDFSRGLCPGEGTNGNATIFYDELPAGTYYYPIIADGNTNDPGPYVMHISVEECSGACLGCLGACCDTVAESCTDAVDQADCADANEQWYPRGDCCAVECRAAGPEYLAQDVELLSRVSIEDFTAAQGGNDVWGFQTALGRKYALIGLISGTGIVDITDPRNPTIVAQVPDSKSTWSDMKYYRGYGYNVNESGGGVQVIDLTKVDQGMVTLLAPAAGGMQTAHNVALDPIRGFLYPCGTDIAQGFMVFDLADPSNPLPVGVYHDVYVHDLQIQAYDSCPLPARAGQPCELAFCFAGSVDFRIVDVTDKSAITTVSTLTYPELSYCHQGWLSPDGRYVYMNDELDEQFGAVSQTRTYVIDVQNVLAPSMAGSYSHPGCWIDHNLMTRGSRVYNAHYAAGLRVLDVTNPTVPNEVAFFDTHPEDNVQDFVGAWGIYAELPRVILISDMERGLFTLCDEPDRSIPSFTVDRNPGYATVPVAFHAASSTTCDPARSLTLYEWDFDYNGSLFAADATGLAVNHTYADMGTYVAALRITDDLGAKEIITLELTVGPPIPAVSAWGLWILTLLLATAGVTLIRRGRARTAQ